VALAGAAIVQAQAPAAEEPQVRVKADHPGRTIFERQCASCHGAGPGDDGAPMLPGTMTLAGKYQGGLPAALELRSDLGAETIRFFVRNGSGAMPMFRKAELSDADVEAVAVYLALTAQANGGDHPRKK
jgi:mono/diheme cytochrome c family protein